MADSDSKITKQLLVLLFDDCDDAIFMITMTPFLGS
jgi:hypothetical protein